MIVHILGRRFEFAEADCWLRVFQQAAQTEERFFFHSGFYCWNGHCKNCRFKLHRNGETTIVQGCLKAPRNGDEAQSFPVGN